FLAPVGHRQEKGDYQESWQPQAMAESRRLGDELLELIATGRLQDRLQAL
ncbi:MAG: hypothetical protein H5U33_23335, partial [Pseudomonas sp.]|nr:hypothetical protein [Pseudomonas sp.]